MVMIGHIHKQIGVIHTTAVTFYFNVMPGCNADDMNQRASVSRGRTHDVTSSLLIVFAVQNGSKFYSTQILGSFTYIRLKIQVVTS